MRFVLSNRQKNGTTQWGLLQKVFQVIFFFSFLSFSTIFAQKGPPANWFNLDYNSDGYPGASTDKAYQDLLKDRQAKPVIVAVLDSGVDYMHEDLKDNMWRNEDEIPDNGIDDDKNGYVDDVYGWNFLGNKAGENIQFDNLEITRQYVLLQNKFAGKDISKLTLAEQVEYERMEATGKMIEEKRKENEETAISYGSVLEAIELLRKDIDKEFISKEDLKGYRSKNKLLAKTAALVRKWMSNGDSFNQIELDLIETFEYYYNQSRYYYNTEYDPRSVIGDNYTNPNDTDYGNSDVIGPDAEHGTHVAGIIAAKRDNQVGVSGVASKVQIMALRVIPDGDERDKDVANAIIYAVDNGASIINMSFGKSQSPNKEIVDKAIKYAQKKDVLIVHAAGNEGLENQVDNNFPNDKYLRTGLFGPKYAENWIEVGAINWKTDVNFVADFSNYSQTIVDLFAPGAAIYSTIPNDQYEQHNGTSMAAPVVAGVAAMLRSYFPELNALQVKNILMESATRYKLKVNKPGAKDRKVAFTHLSVTGGVVNAYAAVQEALRLEERRKKGVAKTKDNGQGEKVAMPKSAE